VVSDASVLINQMLRYPGNRALAHAIGPYLIDNDDWGSRNGKIYVVARNFQESGVFGNQSSIARNLGAFARDQRRWVADLRTTGLPTTASIVLSALACLAGLLWVTNAAARVYERTPPGFARALPLVAQGGVAGRAAVLAAPTTHKALVLLELKKALEESVATRFDRLLPLSTQDLLDTIERSNLLDEAEFRSLKALMQKMGKAETSIAAERNLRVREQDMQRATKQVEHILARMEQKGRMR
jgi:hypothetical protein